MVPCQHLQLSLTAFGRRHWQLSDSELVPSLGPDLKKKKVPLAQERGRRNVLYRALAPSKMAMYSTDPDKFASVMTMIAGCDHC